MLALTLANLKMMARNRHSAFWALFFPLLLVTVFGLFDLNAVGSADLVIVDEAHRVEVEEAEALCQRVAIMDRGRLVAVDTPPNLIKRIDTTYTVKLISAAPLTEDQILSLNGAVASVHSPENNEDNSYLLRLSNAPESLDSVLQGIVHSNINLKHLEIAPVTLEDVFLDLTGNELKD